MTGSTNAHAIVEAYCDAWNRGDLDAIFDLFAIDARYEGTSNTLIGRDAIRQMYERTFASGDAKALIARPVEAHADGLSVAIYEGGKRIAVKQFEIRDGLIVGQSMLE
jgi:uncharacterized protein (TIGR02246 family)